MKNIKIKENKGITLISLVVTIILMIILAGISIVLLFGEQGIITRAKEQKIIQTKAEILEQLELQKTNVLDYDTLYTDLSAYIKYIKANELGVYKVTEIIGEDSAKPIIVVDGKYVYTAAQIENNVVINEVGYIEELDPQIDSFVVTNKTTNKIEVEAKVRRAEKYEFWILKNNEWVKDGTETTGNMNTNEQKTVTYEYKNLTSLGEGEKYQFKIVAIRGKRKVEKTTDSEIKDVEIAEGNLIFDIQPTEWTNKKITTKIYKKTDEEGNILKELENLTIQYQINGTKETLTDNSKWIEYKEPIVTDKNIEIWVRLWDGINAGSATTRTITKIDKLLPTGSISAQTTTNSAKVTVSAQDRDATTEDGNSGIKGYYYSKDGGNTYTSITTETSYTFTGLTQSTSLDLKVKVEDNAGNVIEITESGETSSTLKVADLNIEVSDPDTWTKTTKTITITPSDSNYSKIRYTLDGSVPTTSSTEYTGAFTVNKNCTITAIALDSTNQIGSAATNTVSKIDKLAPTGSISVQTTTNSAKITVTAQDRDATTEDGNSGIKGYYYSKDGGNTYTNITTETTYTFTGLTQSTILDLKVKVEDNAGNITEITESGESSSTLKVADLSIEVSDPDTWTKTKTITITPSDNNYSKIRYTLDGSTPTTSSAEYTGEFTVNKNCTITAIALDSTNQIGSAATNTVSKIDTLAPTGSISVQTTTNSAKITVTAQDRDATTEDGKSEIKGYYYSKDGGNTYTSITAETSYTFTNLTQSTSLNLKVKVEDKAGNVTEITESGESSSTLKVADLTITVSDPNTWTKTKTITITPSNTNYSKIRYTLDGSTPTTSSTEYAGVFTVSSNCTIKAIALDNTNQIGSTATNSVTKIDNTAPGETSITYNAGSNTCSWKESYNLTLSASDSQSGIAYYEIDYTGDGNANTTTGANFVPGDGYSSHTNRFRAVDNVGNKGAWSSAIHIHVHKHKDSCYSTACKGSFSLYSSSSSNYYTCTHYHSSGGGGVWSGTDKADNAYYNSSGGCYTQAGTYSQACSCGGQYLMGNATDGAILYSYDGNYVISTCCGQVVCRAYNFTAKCNSCGATKAHYNPSSMCYCGACGRHVSSINYTTGTTVNVHYTQYPIGQTCTNTVWKPVTKYTRSCGKTSGQSQSFSRTVETYRCSTCGKTSTYNCSASKSCGICGGTHSVGASGAKSTTHNAVSKYLICGK